MDRAADTVKKLVARLADAPPSQERPGGKNHLQRGLVQLNFPPMPYDFEAGLPEHLENHWRQLFAVKELGSLDDQIDHVCTLLALLNLRRLQLPG